MVSRILLLHLLCVFDLYSDQWVNSLHKKHTAHLGQTYRDFQNMQCNTVVLCLLNTTPWVFYKLTTLLKNFKRSPFTNSTGSLFFYINDVCVFIWWPNAFCIFARRLNACMCFCKLCPNTCLYFLKMPLQIFDWKLQFTYNGDDTIHKCGLWSRGRSPISLFCAQGEELFLYLYRHWGKLMTLTSARVCIDLRNLYSNIWRKTFLQCFQNNLISNLHITFTLLHKKHIIVSQEKNGGYASHIC